MKSLTAEGRAILLDDERLFETYVDQFKSKPELLATLIRKLTYRTLSRFRALHQWPYYDIMDDED